MGGKVVVGPDYDPGRREARRQEHGGMGYNTKVKQIPQHSCQKVAYFKIC